MPERLVRRIDQGRLARTTAMLRGDAGLVPRGVFRSSSFEEADAWMTKMMIALTSA